MSSLKALMQERLGKKGAKKPVIEATNNQSSTGKLKEHFDERTSVTLTEAQLCSVEEDVIPFFDESHPNHARHLKAAARLKRDNPALYNKMLNWD